jgi:hypothetical protein
MLSAKCNGIQLNFEYPGHAQFSSLDRDNIGIKALMNIALPRMPI